MHRSLLLASLLLGPSLAMAEPTPTGWHQWRGPNRDGVSPETGLLKEWPAEGPRLVWQAKGVGGGMGSVSIGGGKVFVLGKRKEGVGITALDAATQKEAWFALVSPKGDANGAPTFDGERVYAVSKDGQLVCCDAADGKILWHKDYAADFGGKMMSGWGYSESPLVDGDAVIVVPGANDAMMVALNRKTGDVIWKSALPADVGSRGKDGAGYTGAVISHGAGVKQYLTLAGRGLVSVRASDGQTLWTYNAVANGTANIPTPLVWDDCVFTSSGYGTGAALLELKKEGDGVKADEKYFLQAAEFQNHHGGMVRIGDYIYAGKGHNNGLPTCLEWKTGKIVWEQSERPGKESAAVIAADGSLYFRWQDGMMGLIEATPAGYKLKGSFKLPVIQGQSWPHPAIHDKKLYVRVQDTLLCFDVAGEAKKLP